MTTPELIAWIKKNPIVVACVVLSLALGGAMYYRAGDIPAANEDLDKKSAQARRFAININNAAQLNEQYDAVVAANAAAAERLMRATDIGINQQYFYKLESDTGVKLLEISQAGRTAAKGAYSPISFNVSVEGDFRQVMSFLRALEGGTHYCRILTASMSGGRTTPVKLSLNLELLGHP